MEHDAIVRVSSRLVAHTNEPIINERQKYACSTPEKKTKKNKQINMSVHETVYIQYLHEDHDYYRWRNDDLVQSDEAHYFLVFGQNRIENLSQS